jgi:hypothetical protein
MENSLHSRIECNPTTAPLAEITYETSRRGFLKFAGRAGLGAAGTVALLAAACKSDHTMGPAAGAVVSLPLQSDTDILKFALFLELLESSFYVRAVAGGALTGPVLSLATSIRDHENAHVAALQAALGSSSFGTADVGFDFGASTSSQASFLSTSQALEGTGVGAYLGALASISSKSLRTTAGSIFTIECRHYAAVRAFNNAAGGSVAAAFATPMTPAAVVAAVQATGFVTKGLG